MNTLTRNPGGRVSKLISEILAVPMASGQALVEMHLKQRFLPGDPVPYGRKRRVRHIFLIRDGEQTVKFEVTARASVVQTAGIPVNLGRMKRVST